MTLHADAVRAALAGAVVVDNRVIARERAAILLTLEHTLTIMLLALCDEDPRLGAEMLNEGLVPGVEARLCRFAALQVAAEGAKGGHGDAG